LEKKKTRTSVASNQNYSRVEKNMRRAKSKSNGKKGKRGYRGYLGSGADSITTGFLSPKETLFKLYQADSQGDIKRKFKYVDGKKKTR